VLRVFKRPDDLNLDRELERGIVQQMERVYRDIGVPARAGLNPAVDGIFQDIIRNDDLADHRHHLQTRRIEQGWHIVNIDIIFQKGRHDLFVGPREEV